MESRRTSPAADFFIGGLTQEEGKHFMVWALIVCGVLLALFSAVVAQVLANADFIQAAYGWDKQTARPLAADIRLVALMLFAAGLVERVLLFRREQREDG
jgi:hypothetical protein